MKFLFLTIILSLIIPIDVNYGEAVTNPATVYCIEQGGVSIPLDGAGKPINETNPGIAVKADCKFPDGTICEEFTFLRGECQPNTTPVFKKSTDSKNNSSDFLLIILGAFLGVGGYVIFNKLRVPRKNIDK